MRFLVDMDGVLADFERNFLDAFKSLYPGRPFVPLEERKSFYAEDQYPEDSHNLIKGIMHSKGFYLNMPLIEGSLEAISELSEKNEVYICTSPMTSNPYCLQEKFDWVLKNLGKSWAKRTIITKDKTIIDANYLIDDRPEVTGVQAPSWEHILYTQPYNIGITSKRRLTWQDWKVVLSF